MAPSQVFLEEEEDTIGILVSRLWWMWKAIQANPAAGEQRGSPGPHDPSRPG